MAPAASSACTVCVPRLPATVTLTAAIAGTRRYSRPSPSSTDSVAPRSAEDGQRLQRLRAPAVMRPGNVQAAQRERGCRGRIDDG